MCSGKECSWKYREDELRIFSVFLNPSWNSSETPMGAKRSFARTMMPNHLNPMCSCCEHGEKRGHGHRHRWSTVPIVMTTLDITSTQNVPEAAVCMRRQRSRFVRGTPMQERSLKDNRGEDPSNCPEATPSSNFLEERRGRQR